MQGKRRKGRIEGERGKEKDHSMGGFCAIRRKTRYEQEGWGEVGDNVVGIIGEGGRGKVHRTAEQMAR